MTEHYRARRISETMIRYRHSQVAGKWVVRDIETGQLLEGASYDDEALAKVKCRMQAADDIERLYVPDRATAMARVAAIIGEQSDVQWAAKLIVEYFAGAKA